MPLWGRNDADANTAPKYNIEAGTTETGITSFGNTTVVNGRAVGTFGVDVTEAGLANGVTHPGWVVVRQGSGYVDDLTISAGGSGYDNVDTIEVSGGTINATATLTTNATGGITSVTLGTKGSGFKNVDDSTVTITTVSGTGATIVPVLGGRAGRVSMETMVAMGTITGDAADDDTFPDA